MDLDPLISHRGKTTLRRPHEVPRSIIRKVKKFQFLQNTENDERGDKCLVNNSREIREPLLVLLTLLNLYFGTLPEEVESNHENIFTTSKENVFE